MLIYVSVFKTETFSPDRESNLTIILSIFYIVTFLLSKQRVLEGGKSLHFQENEKFIRYAFDKRDKCVEAAGFEFKFLHRI